MVDNTPKTTWSHAWPQSILMVGCGLIGVSLAKALRKVLNSETLIDGVEQEEGHRRLSESYECFRQVFPDMPTTGSYALVILAVPADAACNLLQQASIIGEIVMDVCSVKTDICEAADHLDLRGRFFPSHPMAGLAAQGPARATAELFNARPWLGIAGWEINRPIVALLQSLGATWTCVPSPQFHDRAMSVVSHSIHITSLSTMLAVEDALMDSTVNSLTTATDHQPVVWSREGLSRLSGPALADITRLAASPTGFWTSTLLANSEAVCNQLHNTIAELMEFAEILEQGDRQRLEDKLRAAQLAHRQWFNL